MKSLQNILNEAMAWLGLPPVKSQEINLDYILALIFEHNKKKKSKDDLVDEIRRVIRASLGNRAKESLGGCRI